MMAGLFDFITTPVSKAEDPLAAREKWLGLASIFQGMTMDPTAGQAGIQTQLQGIQQQRQQSIASKAKQDRVAMAVKLLSPKYPELAQYVAQGLMTPEAAITEARKPAAKVDTTEMERAYKASIADGSFVGSYLDFIKEFKGAGASRTNVNVGGDKPILAKPEAGTQIIEEDGVYRQVPIGGGSAAIDAQKQVDLSKQAIDVIDKALGHSGLSKAVGPYDARTLTLRPDATAFEALHDQIKGKTFLAAFESLKGGGQITEVEGQKAEQAMARLNLAQDEADYRNALKDLRNVIEIALKRNQGVISSIPTASTTSNVDPLGLR